MNVNGAWRMAFGLLVAACLSIVPMPAFAEDDSPAYEIFDNYLSQSNSVAEFNNYLINDLANRWFYADSSKRSAVPVIQSAWTNIDASLETTLEEADGSPSDAAYIFSTGQALITYLNIPFVPSQVYKLVTLDNGLAWDSSAMRARDYYRAWYEWFEGTSGSDGGDVQPVEGVYYVDCSHVTFISPTSNTSAYSNVFVGAAYNPSTNSASGGTSTRYYTNTLQDTYTPTWPDTVQVRVSASLYQRLHEDGYDLLVVTTPTGSSDTSRVSIVKVETGTYTLSLVSTPYSTITLSGSADVYHTTVPNYMSDGVQFNCYVDSSFGTITRSAGTYRLNALLSNANAQNGYLGYLVGGDAGGGDDEPVWPVWPEPENPDEPDVPSQPTNVTINWNNNTYNQNQTTTTTVDLQPILDAIRIVNDNLESGFLGLEADIRSFYDGMEQLLTSWFQYFGSWFQTISSQLDTWYRLFLQEMRTANNWLRAIYYKSWGGNSSQPDVTSDTDNYWNWLYELLGRIIEMLPDSLQEIITQMAQLQNYFPFSVPWDVAFLLGLLDAEPVTPVIHGYLPTWGANGFVAQGVPLTIDLTEFDDIALLLRRAELLFFAVTLLPATYDVLKGFKDVLQS